MNENESFKTSDLSLAAALRCHGATIQDVDKSSPRAIFHIRHSGNVEELARSFWAHSLRVDPLVYFNCLKEVKSRLYADTR